MIDETLLIDALRPLGVGKAFEALFLVPRDWIDLRPERLLAGIDAPQGVAGRSIPTPETPGLRH